MAMIALLALLAGHATAVSIREGVLGSAPTVDGRASFLATDGRTANTTWRCRGSGRNLFADGGGRLLAGYKSAATDAKKTADCDQADTSWALASGDLVPPSELPSVDSGRTTGVGGMEVCRLEGDGSSPTVRVWLVDKQQYKGKEVNIRMLQFNPPASGEPPLDAQSELRCLGAATPGCSAGTCQECPCIRDSRDIVAPSMQLAFSRVEPVLCHSSGDRQLLLLGMGGGELAQHLLEHCPNLHIDGVELDPKVIELGRRYLGLMTGPKLHMTQGSALDVTDTLVRKGQKKYDAVIIDCYSAGGQVPKDCRSGHFFENIYSVLKPGGLVLQGIWHYAPNEAAVAQQFIETKEAYTKQFGKEPVVLQVDLPLDVMWASILAARRPEPYDMGKFKRFGSNKTLLH